MSDLSTLRPTDNRRVMDLVKEAGIDVSDWADHAGGAAKAAANPKYCYEWSFVEPGKVIVLNLWHSELRERHGVITLKDNTRASAAKHSHLHTRKDNVLARRAESFDQAVRKAAVERLPIRVIICDGPTENRSARPSKATARTLDPVPWAVSVYDFETGQFTLTRGAQNNRLVDQFMVDTGPMSPTETRNFTTTAFVRDETVRQAALARAGGRCEWCHEPGFTMQDGAIFLETHHVVPLSEGGPDTIANVVALCPNHHREAHHGAARKLMRDRLLRIDSEPTD